MPFRSKKQMKACFASNGFNGKVDCKEWAHETNMKKLKQAGGTIDVSPFLPPDPNNMKLKYEDLPPEYWEMMGVKPPQPKTSRKFNPMSIGLGMQAAGTGLNWLSGIMERGRQNQYMYSQLATLGQLDAVPVEDYQPNPFSLYARYGGSLKKWTKKKK